MQDSPFSVKQVVELINTTANPSGDLDLFVIVHSSPCVSYGVLGRIMIKQIKDGTIAAMTLNGIGPRKPMAAKLESKSIINSKGDVYSAIMNLIYQLKLPLLEAWHIALPDENNTDYVSIRKLFSKQDLNIQQILTSEAFNKSESSAPGACN